MSDKSNTSQNAATETARPAKRRQTDKQYLRDALVPKKRGRRPKNPDRVAVVPVSSEAKVDEDDLDVDSEEKRKLQNRAAQRAFRERREKHVKDLEDQIERQDEQIRQLKARVDQLEAENAQLKSQGRPTTLSPVDTASSEPIRADALTPSVSPTDEQRPQPVSTASATGSNGAALQTKAIMSADLPRADDFDFDSTPFDYSSVPIPPLFQDFFEQSFIAPVSTPGPSTISALSEPITSLSRLPTPVLMRTTSSSNHVARGVTPTVLPPASQAESSNANESDVDMCPMDDNDDPAALDQVPCAECDFTAMSCNLPMPWRPPGLEQDVLSKDVWIAKKAWAKLCSHPLFSQCDVEELCAELKSRTRCSDDGRVVVTKAEVCDVFRTIPARAKLAQQRLELDQVDRHVHVS